MKNIIWLRDENRLTERRTPLLPTGAKRLVNEGYEVVVERSEKRIIPDQDFANAGCRMVNSGSWISAPKHAVILGLKELPARPVLLRNSHIYFAHAYKQQHGWQDLLRRFTDGGGDLIDIEYMIDNGGRRVVAFGFWAGYMGAALALIHWHNRRAGTECYLDQGLSPFDNADLLHKTINKNHHSGQPPKVLVIGASGRCGQGALDILKHHGAEITCWGRDDTRHINRAAVRNHDILINCALVKRDIPAFVRRQDLMPHVRLSVIADVSCDPFSNFNPIPLYHDVTSWDKPYLVIRGPDGLETVDIIAIDNLPSLLPRESSREFSDQLLPHLMTLNRRSSNPVWAAARNSFDNAVAAMDNGRGKSYKIHTIK